MSGPILLTAWFNRPWAMGHYLEHALKRLGHAVETLDYRESQDCGKALVEKARKVRPSLSVLFKGDGVPPEAVKEVRAMGCPAVHWHGDTNWERPDWLMNLARAHDHYFTHALGLVDRMRKGGIENVTWLSEGFEPEFYAFAAISAAERTRYETDVLFIGNLHVNSYYWPRQAMVAASLRAGFRTRWWGPRIPRKFRFIPLLLSPVARAYGGGMVFNDTWAKAVSCSKIFIAREVHPEVLASMSNRSYTAMGCGAFYLCYHTEGIEKVFEVGKELDTFRTLDEMVEKIRYYLDHEDQRRSIAEAGRKRVLENYTYADRFQEMFRVLEERGLWKPA